MSFFLVQIEEPGGQLTLFLAELSGEGQQRMLAQEFWVPHNSAGFANQVGLENVK